MNLNTDWLQWSPQHHDYIVIYKRTEQEGATVVKCSHMGLKVPGLHAAIGRT